MDTKHLVIESTFLGKGNEVAGRVAVIHQMPTTGGIMVTLGRAAGAAPDALVMHVYHDVAGNGFTVWPEASTLNRETLVAILAAFDRWLADYSAPAWDNGLVRVFCRRWAEYKDAYAVLTMHG